MLNCWSAAASTGVVDERARDFVRLGRVPGLPVIAGGNPPNFADSRIFGTGDSAISLARNAPQGVYSVRYHVGPIENDVPNPQTVLSVRYLVDDHAEGRVVVQLKKFNLERPPADEVAEIIGVFDSMNHNPLSQFQFQSIDVGEGFDFMQNAYFVEAMLINTKQPSIFEQPGLDDGTHPSPALAAIRVCRMITSGD
jgi:hypothetical protein